MTHEPSTFDWWSGIIIPAGAGLLSLLLAGASLWIAIVAWRVAHKTREDGMELTRRDRAQRLASASEEISQLIWKRDFDEAWSAARSLNREQWIGGDKAARSIANQLVFWALYAMQHRPEKDLSSAIATDIVFEVDAAIGEYANGVEEGWHLDKRTVDDLPDRDPIESRQ